jgi:antitoxin FitA
MHYACSIRETVRIRSMTTIQIREVPSDVHASLRDHAAAAGLSLSEFMLREATKIAGRPAISEVLRRATTKTWGVSPGAAVHALRAIRDEDGGR